MPTLAEIVDALITLGITSDTLFERIQDDLLVTGSFSDARAQLDFVDQLIEARKVEAGRGGDLLQGN